jgi:hypothetical protein
MEMAAPGPFELLIIGLVCLLPIIVGIVLAVVLISRSRLPTNPDLQPCPDCGRRLSPRAASCPHCGCPLQGT